MFRILVLVTLTAWQYKPYCTVSSGRFCVTVTVTQKEYKADHHVSDSRKKNGIPAKVMAMLCGMMCGLNTVTSAMLWYGTVLVSNHPAPKISN